MSSEGSGRNFAPGGRPPEYGSEQQLPTIEVDNEVVWANPDIPFPFIELGKRCKFGVFLSEHAGGNASPLPLTAMKHHGRSGLMGRLEFYDKQGRRWRDVNGKGGGGMRPTANGSHEVVYPGFGEDMETGSYGISDWQYAEQDRVKSEFFLKKGLRTHRTIAILMLKELAMIGGGTISTKDAEQLGYIHKGEQPVLQLRAYGTQARLENATEMDYALLKDAIALVAEELKREKLSITDYLKWFASTLGQQVAIMHTWNHCHGFLIEHNITLDCRITDLDTLDKFPSSEKERRIEALHDLFIGGESFTSFIDSISDLWTSDNNLDTASNEDGDKAKLAFREELLDTYFRAYVKRLNSKALLHDTKFMKQIQNVLDNNPEQTLID